MDFIKSQLTIRKRKKPEEVKRAVVEILCEMEEMRDKIEKPATKSVMAEFWDVLEWHYYNVPTVY
jgi:hypothetical protein